MAYAIDCDGIRKMIASGIPNRWAFLAPGEIGYDPSLKPYPYDPKKARDSCSPKPDIPMVLSSIFIGCWGAE